MSSKKSKIYVTKKIFMKIQGVTKESLDKSESTLKIKSELFFVQLDDNFTKWSLAVYPNGGKDEHKSNIGFYFNFEDFDSTNFKATFRLGLDGKTEKGNYSYVTVFFEKSGDIIKELKGIGLGIPRFISHETLFNKRSDLIVNGTLTFFCDLTLSTLDGTLEVKKISPEHAHGVDMAKIFTDALFTDFELQMSNGATLKAHKAILAARSSVFLAMFTTDMKEARENFVNISEFNSVVMQEVLRYIYCNEVQGLDKIVHKLIYAADKYQLDGLREICVDRIIELLSIKNVVESLVIADRLRDTKLWDECVDLLATNCKFDEISNTNEWKDNLPTLGTKVISKLIKRNVEEHLMPHKMPH